MIRKVFFGAILVLHLVQCGYALPVAQQDAPPKPNPEPLPMPFSMPESMPTTPMIPLPMQMTSESRQEQPMPMQMPDDTRQEQPMHRDEPMPMHNDPMMMMIAMRNPAHAGNDHQNKEMQMRGSWRDQQHSHDQMHHGHMTHNHNNHNMMAPKDEHKPMQEHSWSKAEQMDKHHPVDSMDASIKPLVEQFQKVAIEQSHPSKARSMEDGGVPDVKPNHFANHLLGMHQNRQAYQSPQQQHYRPQSPCSKLMVGCSPTVQQVPCSYGSASASYQSAPLQAIAPAYHSLPASYYAAAPVHQYHVAPNYPNVPAYSDVHQQPGPPYVDTLLGTTNVHHLHKHQQHHQHQHQHQHENSKQHYYEHVNQHQRMQHKDSHPESTNVATHSNHNESEKDVKIAAEKQTEIESTKTADITSVDTTLKATKDHSLHELEKKLRDHTVTMAQFHEAAKEEIKKNLKKSAEVHEHKAHESCVEACGKKLSDAHQLLQQNLLE